MSIKTLRKRIALVAVSALGVGLLSVAPANAADVPLNGFVDGSLYLVTTRDGDGTANAKAVDAALTTASTSVGWITDTSATAQTTETAAVYASGGQIRSGVVLSNAQIGFVASQEGTDGLTVTVTGGTLTQLNATGSADVITLSSTHINSSFTTVTVDQAGTYSNISGIFNISAAVGSVATISVFTGANIAGLTTATAGDMVAQYQLTVAAASLSGAVSAADSTVTQQACLASADTPLSNTYDTVSRCGNGAVGAVYVDIEDAYGAQVTTGTLTATASNSALTVISDTAAAGSTINSATSSYDDHSNTDGEVWVYVKQPTANTAGTSTVTISRNGTVLGTKTINWAGDIATLVVDTANSNSIFSTNQADVTTNIGAAGVIYVAKDAAGNALTLTAQPSVSAATGALVGSTTSSTTVATYAALQTSSRGYGYTMLVVPNNPLSGASTYQLEITNAAGATIKSQVVNATVSRGSTDSFAVSWDKAAYKFGDIATLTITVKDAYGNLMADGTALAGLTDNLTVSSGGFSAVGGTCTSTSTTLGGKKTCKYAALNTEGSYSYSVDLSTATPQSAIVGTLPLSASSAAVSNAEVLAAIVKLIASINKQIRALQKSLRR